MKKKKTNVVWRFFTSVKLALFCLFTLAGASIIGTIIPQNDMPYRYIELYGSNAAKLFQLLDIPDMYNSWWFLSLLSLFALNLTVCTIDRFPHIWKIVTQDNLNTKIERLQKMPIRRQFNSTGNVEQTQTEVGKTMAAAGWKANQRALNNGMLFFSQKGAWTRLGVIIVHVSILFIFAGALIGKFYGFKAMVMLPEGESTKVAYKSTKDHPLIPLGFTLTCNNFNLSYYDTGMPKEFRSDLVVEKDGKRILAKSIVVNDPLQYGGLTFYQSNYQEIAGQFIAMMINETSKASQKFIVPFPTKQPTKWSAENISFGITDISGPDMMRHFRYKIWFSDGKGNPSTFWIDQGSSVKIKRPGNNYLFFLKPRFATGLQIAKDPGVWVVYTGCFMMILGLIIIFFISHRRIWGFVSKNEAGETHILISGTSNKDRIGFEKVMLALYQRFEKSQLLQGKNHE